MALSRDLTHIDPKFSDNTNIQPPESDLPQNPEIKMRKKADSLSEKDKRPEKKKKENTPPRSPTKNIVGRSQSFNDVPAKQSTANSVPTTFYSPQQSFFFNREPTQFHSFQLKDLIQRHYIDKGYKPLIQFDVSAEKLAEWNPTLLKSIQMPENPMQFKHDISGLMGNVLLLKDGKFYASPPFIKMKLWLANPDANIDKEMVPELLPAGTHCFSLLLLKNIDDTVSIHLRTNSKTAVGSGHFRIMLPKEQDAKDDEGYTILHHLEKSFILLGGDIYVKEPGRILMLNDKSGLACELNVARKNFIKKVSDYIFLEKIGKSDDGLCAQLFENPKIDELFKFCEGSDSVVEAQLKALNFPITSETLKSNTPQNSPQVPKANNNTMIPKVNYSVQSSSASSTALTRYVPPPIDDFIFRYQTDPSETFKRIASSPTSELNRSTSDLLSGMQLKETFILFSPQENSFLHNGFTLPKSSEIPTNMIKDDKKKETASATFLFNAK